MDVLPDVLGPNLRVVFCGTAVGKQSAVRRAYYAGDGNKFWPTLCSVCLTDRLVKPENYKDVMKYRIGLTDLVKTVSGADSDLKASHFDIDRLRNSILTYKPYALAFTSKKAGQTFLGKKRVYGLQSELLGATRVYVLPSTSGLANAHWSPVPWQALADDLKSV